MIHNILEFRFSSNLKRNSRYIIVTIIFFEYFKISTDDILEIWKFGNLNSFLFNQYSGVLETSILSLLFPERSCVSSNKQALQCQNQN